MTKTQKKWLIVGGVLAGVLFLARRGAAATNGNVAMLSYLGQSSLPRGMRNNNPGNIRISNNPWQGKIPTSQNTDGAFEQFEAYVWGIRAMVKNLLTYFNNYNLRTIRQVVSTWAPANENDTNGYINFVASQTGFGPDQELDLQNLHTMRALVKAMTKMENGREAVTDSQFNYAWSIL